MLCSFSACSEWTPSQRPTSAASSDRAHSSTPHTAYSSDGFSISSQSVTSEAEPKTVKRQRRRGKRISLLREAYPPDSPAGTSVSEQFQRALVSHTKLSPTSTESRGLAGLELRAALSYDLIRQAWTSLDALYAPSENQPGAVPLRQKFSLRSLESEVVTAALLAVGAMSSTHSAIVGRVKRLNHHPSPDDLVALGLGRRREAAVQVLAARSVAIARESGILESADPYANEVGGLLRLVMVFNARNNPFMIELRDNLRFRQAFEPPETTKRALNSLIAGDAFVGLTFDRKLEVTDGDLVRFGFKDVRAREARKRLEGVRASNADVDEDVLDDIRHCGMILMRDMVRIQTSSLEDAGNSDAIVAEFTSLYAMLDLLLDSISRVPSSLEQQSFRSNLFTRTPIFLESTIAHQVTRHAKAHPESPRARALLVRAQRRFLNALARSSHTLNVDTLGGDQLTTTAWNALDVFPEWDQLAIEGAKQNGKKEAPLAGTSWTWTEFERTHEFLKVSTATFAASDARERRFRMAWEERQAEVVESERMSVLARLAGVEELTAKMRSTAEGALAGRMVDRALVELTA